MIKCSSVSRQDRSRQWFPEKALKAWPLWWGPRRLAFIEIAPQSKNIGAYQHKKSHAQLIKKALFCSMKVRESEGDRDEAGHRWRWGRRRWLSCQSIKEEALGVRCAWREWRCSALNRGEGCRTLRAKSCDFNSNNFKQHSYLCIIWRMRLRRILNWRASSPASYK